MGLLLTALKRSEGKAVTPNCMGETALMVDEEEKVLGVYRLQSTWMPQ